MTRIIFTAGLLWTLHLTHASCGQEVPAAVSTATATPPAVSLPSVLLQPCLGALRQSMDGVRLDKWKASGTVRQKADANLNSIRHDLDATLPGLLTRADAAPTSVAEVLPLARNVDALYDVVLRVANTAELAAPAPQSAALADALSQLDAARHALGDRLQSSAVAAEQQVRELQTNLNARVLAAAAAAACPPAPVKKTVAPAPHAKTARKPTVKSAPKPAATPPPSPPKS